MKKLALLSVLLLTGCTQVAGGALVYAISSQSEKQEKRGKRFTAVDRCLFKGKPNAFITGEKIAYGEPLTAQFEQLLYVAEGKEEGEPVPPHHLAYAFYTIADRIGDKRAAARKDWLKPYLTDEKPEDLEQTLHKKFMDSYLEKCFAVPEQYKIYRSHRDNIG